MKRRNKIVSVLVLIGIFTLMFTSCSIEKRVYRKGYHVVWNHKKAKEVQKTEVVQLAKHEPKTDLVASEKDPELISSKRTPLLVLDKDTCGDKLLLQNADELFVKVLEIDDNFIKYKRCDNASGPTYSIAKNKVAMITYVNGTKEVIQNQPSTVYRPDTKQPTAQNAPPKTNGLGMTSLLGHIVLSIASQAVVVGTGASSSIFLILLLWIAVIIMAYASLFQFKNEPGRYKGKWMPIVVILFNAIGFLIFGLIFTGYGGATGLAAIFFLIGLAMIGLLIAGLLPKAQPTKN